jgi:hypothetical protein
VSAFSPPIARKIVLDIYTDINVERGKDAPVVAVDWISNPKPELVTNDTEESWHDSFT